MKVPVTLTIAGSDCSGGAGIEADLKTFTAHKVYGMAAVTCVVAENPGSVHSIYPVTSREVANQLQCCLEGMKSVYVKTGMLYSDAIVRCCNHTLNRLQKHIAYVVVDPVMVATSGKRLLQANGINALKTLITNHADLVTPNLDEAEILSGMEIKSPAEMEAAAELIAKKYSTAVLLKGGHLKTSKFASDFILERSERFWVRDAWVRGIQTHGTGCTYSAAITANLAKGKNLKDAVKCSKRYLTQSIRRSVRFPNWMALRHY